MPSDAGSSEGLYQWLQKQPPDFYRQFVLLGGGGTLAGYIATAVPAFYVGVAFSIIMVAGAFAWSRQEDREDGDPNGI